MSVTFSPPVTVNVDATGKLVITPVGPPPPQPPSADFTFSPIAPKTGDLVTFGGSATGGSGVFTYAWNFGDTTAGSGNPVTHSFATAGTFNVTLTVTDSLGAKATATHSIVVGAPPGALTADFTFSPAAPRAGAIVSFVGTTSGGVSPYTYGWSFGDGSTGAGPSVIHTFATAGTFNVTLTATDSAANTATATHSVVVVQPPPPPTKLTLTFEGFDYDGARENILTLNGKVIASLPVTDNPPGQAWTPFSLDITTNVVQGSNTLVFSHAPWDCAVNDNVRNLQIIDQNGGVVFSDPTERIVNCTTSTSYAFNIGGPPPPPPPPGSQQPTLTITSTPNPSTPGASVSITGKLALSSGAGLGAQTVNLQQSIDQGVTWTPLGTTQTAADGTYAFTQTFTAAGSYQLRTQFLGA